MMRVRSASRPKNSPASFSRKQSRPTYGPSGGAHRSAGATASRASLSLQLVQELRRALLDHVHAEVLPELALDGIRVGVHRHGPGALEPVAPDALEEDAPRPVLHPVAQEEEVALAHLVEDLHRDQALDGALRQVADVVVLGDDEVVAERSATRARGPRCRRGA